MYEKNNIIVFSIFAFISFFLISIGIWSLGKNITMKEAIGEITYCERRYDYHNNKHYWVATAKFSVDDQEYEGHINITSRKYIGDKIKILYNPKDPNDFDSKSSTYAGFSAIIFGFLFLLPIYQSKRHKKDIENS